METNWSYQSIKAYLNVISELILDSLKQFSELSSIYPDCTYMRIADILVVMSTFQYIIKGLTESPFVILKVHPNFTKTKTFWLYPPIKVSIV